MMMDISYQQSSEEYWVLIIILRRLAPTKYNIVFNYSY